MAGCTGLEPVASGVTVGGPGLAGSLQLSQDAAIAGNDPIGTSAFSPHLAAVFSPLGIPLVSGFEVADSCLPLLSVREVAQRLNVATSTVYKICAEGKLPHARVSNAIRVPEAALATYVDARRLTSDANSEPTN